jgi:N-acetyl-gamma-glutamyl-phosphate reductase
MATRVGVVGASGYGGAELLRILASHPVFDVAIAAAGSNAGERITSLHPGLIPYADMTFAPTSSGVVEDLDLVFLALPHGQSAELTADLDPAQRVVDLGADHRLRDPSEWNSFYGPNPAAEPWTYGLPELPERTKQIASSTKVANPGCYATAIQLSAAPLLAAGLAKPIDIVVAAASGTSGAGRKASIATSATEVMGSMAAYKVGGTHQHIAEVRQELSTIAGSPVQLSFTPMLAPMPRGILASTSVRLADSVTLEQLLAAFDAAYGDSPFVHLLPAGQWPTTGATSGTNCAHLQVALDEATNRATVVAAIDNLGKGAAGQAVQNANLMCGLAPDLGLTTMAVAP